jgi:predicted RNA-binding Zn-ribbon protein involved in translation (DUF1610 family)
MGYKAVCFECIKSLNRKLDTSDKIYLCPECGQSMTLLSHRFRPPMKSDTKKWETVKYLIEHGFYYQHIYQSVEVSGKTTIYKNYATYPENIRDAKEFVEKYKSQAQKSN